MALATLESRMTHIAGFGRDQLLLLPVAVDICRVACSSRYSAHEWWRIERHSECGHEKIGAGTCAPRGSVPTYAIGFSGIAVSYHSLSDTIQHRRADNISSYSTLIDRLEQCEGISQQDDRLSCFDAVAKVIAPVQKTDSSTYKEFKIADLKTDIQLLNGIKVSVAGRGYMLSDDFIMSEERGSVDMIYVNTSELPREERLTINRSCSGGCVVTVKGTVGKIRNGFGIYADHIEVQ